MLFGDSDKKGGGGQKKEEFKVKRGEEKGRKETKEKKKKGAPVLETTLRRGFSGSKVMSPRSMKVSNSLLKYWIANESGLKEARDPV